MSMVFSQWLQAKKESANFFLVKLHIFDLTENAQINYSHCKRQGADMVVNDYINELNREYLTGNATEHSYRPALKKLIENILITDKSSPLHITNEPKRIECGAPDYIITKNNIPVCYIEAKDIGVDLHSKQHKAQFQRYIHSLDNLVITDYLCFQFYQKQEHITTIAVAEVRNGKISPIKENFARFINFIIGFANAEPQRITNPKKLAEIMANKAKLIAEVIEKIVTNDNEKSVLKGEMEAIRDMLIKELTPSDFADVYAQSITYGMFSARLHNPNTNAFSRTEIAKLIPKTNPFLRQLFYNIAGIDLDERLCWIVDDLAETFRVADMASVMKDDKHDPIIHFYEDFLTAYNPELRKSKGVYYTPIEVVSFIVRAVDDILINDFNIPMGLADVTKIPSLDGNIHKLQILDPATGTGTFLKETINLIHSKFKSMQGAWANYVDEHLIPRLNGFEILMAPYTIAHLQLDWLLAQTGYTSESRDRLKIYLTNALDEFHKGLGTIFSQFLVNESKEADNVKRDTPVMIVMGNPPYNVSSQNSSSWIMQLLNDYKKEPYTDTTLQEKNFKAINDDYCKFIRLGQYFVNKNSEGILAFITNNSFLDTISLRGMRWNLLKSFDKIYIIDLHGSSLKKETAPDGSKDENVFNIQQGVSINIFIKKSKTNSMKDVLPLADVYHYDLFGLRNDKLALLSHKKLSTIAFSKIEPLGPDYYYVPKDFSYKDDYANGFKLNELFTVNGVGICSKRDDFAIHMEKNTLINTINEFISISDDVARERFNLGIDTDWTVASARKVFTNQPDFTKIVKINYRPFDIRYTYYTEKKGFLARPVYKVMKHLIQGHNIGLLINKPKNGGSDFFSDVFITNIITDQSLFFAMKRSPFLCPLYLYPDSDSAFVDQDRKPNLDETIVKNISQRIALEFTPEKETDPQSQKFAPIDLLDYIYAVLHNPIYREKYKEFLKIDFPQVPYPESVEQFWQYVGFGSKLRRLHLLEIVEPDEGLASFSVEGNMLIEKLHFTGNKIYINNTQYFDNVPDTAWSFYIGGYQPAQKWLKDRKGRHLNFDEITHYRKIIKVLIETDDVMKDIKKISE